MKQIDKGILLRKINYSESSLIVTIYTQRQGVQTFIFQGGKKKSSYLFPMSLLEIEFYKRPDSELGKLTSAQPFKGTSVIPFHPIRSSIAYFMADVLYQSLKTDQSDLYLFQVLENQLMELEGSHDFGRFPILFLIALSRALGIEPIIVDENALYFVPVDGEFRCDHGFGAHAEKGRHVDMLRTFYQNRKDFPSDKETRSKALLLLLKYFEIHIPAFNVERSLEVLKEVLE